MVGKLQPCKVVIIGGSVAGLSLANMLEQVGIDFVVLESHKQIAPQLGASIAIYPHFARILDQIGCCMSPFQNHHWGRAFANGVLCQGDSLANLTSGTLANHAFFRDRWGKSIFDFRGLADSLEQRHGYPVIFVERQMLLEVLYKNLRSKVKVLVQKKFIKVLQMRDGIRAIMEDGSCYEADFLVGADGMHSSVRKEMHSLRSLSTKLSFDRDEYSKVPSSYSCIFGMSHPTKGIEQGTSHTILGKGSSYIFLTGGGKIYWFLNTKNSQVAHGEEALRRYSTEDERQLAKEHFGDQLNEHDTFEDVYKQRIMSTLTPLHEYQWKHWHFERIITIGDASHKLHPISGNGGAAAAEDAAALVNALHRKLQDRTHRLSTEDCELVFAETQRAREKRTKTMLHHATKMQEFDAMQSLFAPLLVKFVVPNLTDDAALNIIGENVLGGQRIEALPMPQRPRYVPYVDELPARPLNDLRVGKVFAAILQSGFALPLIMVNILRLFKGTPYHLDSYLEHYTHTATVSGEASCSTQSCMVALIPIVLIWNIEGFRRGNTKSLGSWPITMVFISALAVARSPVTFPLYFLLSTCNSERSAYASPAGRPIPPSVVAAATACNFAVYALLVIMNVTHQNLYPRSPLWRWTPVFFSIIIRVLAAQLAKKQHKCSSHTKPGKDYLEVYLNQDYSPLMTMYGIVFVMALVAHLFSPIPPSFLQALIIPVGAWCLSSVYEMRRLGYATTREAIVAMVCILALGRTVGAGAVYAGTWTWREKVLYRLNK